MSEWGLTSRQHVVVHFGDESNFRPIICCLSVLTAKHREKTRNNNNKEKKTGPNKTRLLIDFVNFDIDCIKLLMSDHCLNTLLLCGLHNTAIRLIRWNPSSGDLLNGSVDIIWIIPHV